MTPETFIWAHRCLNGEITSGMRMVAISSSGNRVTFRYYLDHPPTEFVQEQAEIVALNFDAGLSYRLETLDIEFVHSKEPLGKLDTLDYVLFRRWENDENGTEPDD